MRKRELPKIQSNWLHSLPEKRRKGVLFIVSMIVFDRCTSEERVNHSISIMRYTAEAGNQRLLNEWMKLNNYRNYKDIFDEFSDIPANKITNLSLKPELYYPFEPMGAEKLIIPEKSKLTFLVQFCIKKHSKLSAFLYLIQQISVFSRIYP